MLREDESNADLISMLLANLAKSDFITRLLAVQLAPRSSLSTSRNAMDQLMDCFVRGAEGAYNTKADFDYLAYLFADMAKAYDAVVPVTKVIVFTEHRSVVRRKGVASTVKNITFDVPSHALLTGPRVNLLPYVLLPLTGGEEYDEDEMLSMPADLQLLPESKRRDPDASILVTHLETLLLLTATRPMRELLREIGVYPIVRETHLHVEDEDVREACDRLVQVLKRDEPEIDEADEIKGDGRRKGAPRVEEVDEEETIVEIF
ncbi:MAG: hypothetical protein M1838_003369 [Thelocarpon superellum]|nr:MAG: hypothetical protein M1838_003369 [Thelocarpon superellum]